MTKLVALQHGRVFSKQLDRLLTQREIAKLKQSRAVRQAMNDAEAMPGEIDQLRHNKQELTIALKETVRALKVRGVLDRTKTYYPGDLQTIPDPRKGQGHWFGHDTGVK